LIAALTAVAVAAVIASPASARTMPTQDAPEVVPTESFTPLTLQNGWTNSPFSTRPAKAAVVGGVVYLRGAIANGTGNLAFTLPPGMRPAREMFVQVGLCDAANGRLYIQPNGEVRVGAEDLFADAQCFTSLEGASFALAAPTPLTLQNGWTNAPLGTGPAKASLVSGIVHLRGAIADGTVAVAFTLPAGMRPSAKAYVPVDLCNATDGCLIIFPDGRVKVQAEGTFADAQCTTSLDGASFVLNAPTVLSLRSGWTGGPFHTRMPKAKLQAGIVHFQGAIAASGSNPVAFGLPVGMRPTTVAYVPIDLCGAANGRLAIQPTGRVFVEAQGPFSDAQCFTSLDGAWFAL
jgi:hypothetical protein